jgi:hypothetical protein
MIRINTVNYLRTIIFLLKPKFQTDKIFIPALPEKKMDNEQEYDLTDPKANNYFPIRSSPNFLCFSEIDIRN